MRFKLLAATALLTVGSACSSGSLTDETLGSARRVGLRSDKVKADLLICSPAERVVVVKQIGPEGGVIHAGGHKFHIPNGSLAAPVTITTSTSGSASARAWLSLSSVTVRYCVCETKS